MSKRNSFSSLVSKVLIVTLISLSLSGIHYGQTAKAGLLGWLTGAVLQVAAVDSSSVTLTWPAASSELGLSIKHYRVDVNSNSFVTSDLTYKVTGLNPSTTYTFNVLAVYTDDSVSSALSKTVSTAAALAPLIQDPGLESAIRKQLNKSDGELVVDDLLGLEFLDASSRNITSLAGLENAVNLKSLDLSYNSISDVTLLSSLTSLTSLNLNDNMISDISALSGLANVSTLYMNYNQISNITVLGSLNQLIYLSLSNNYISDISALSGLTQLTFLNLFGNEITDITALVNNVGLGAGDQVDINLNPLDESAQSQAMSDIATLKARGVMVLFDMGTGWPQLPPGGVEAIWPTDAELSYSDLTEAGVSFAWPAAEGSFDKYRVTAYDESDHIAWDAEVASPATTLYFGFEQLTPGATYRFVVDARNQGDDYGSYGPVVFITIPGGIQPGDASIGIQSDTDYVHLGSETDVTLVAYGVEDLYSFQLDFKYDPQLFTHKAVELHSAFGMGNGYDPNSAQLYYNEDEHIPGLLRIVATKQGGSSGVTIADGIPVLKITLQANSHTAAHSSYQVLRSSTLSDYNERPYALTGDSVKYVQTVVGVEGVKIDQVGPITVAMGGAPYQLTASVTQHATIQAVLWHSSDNSVVVIDSNGRLMPLKNGKATITVTTVDGGLTDTIEVDVVTRVSSIEILIDDIYLNMTSNTSIQIPYLVHPAEASNPAVLFMNDPAHVDDPVVTLSDTGIVTAVRPGHAVIKVQSAEDSNVYDTVQVFVAGEASFQLMTPVDIIAAGEKTTVTIARVDDISVHSFKAILSYDPQYFDFIKSESQLHQDFNVDGAATVVIDDSIQGMVTVTGYLPTNVEMSVGNGLMNLVFQAKGDQATHLRLEHARLDKLDGAAYEIAQPVSKRVAVTYADFGGWAGTDVTDLTKVAKAFNPIAEIDPQSELSKLDVNKDNRIDIEDIAYIALRILRTPIGG